MEVEEEVPAVKQRSKEEDARDVMSVVALLHLHPLNHPSQEELLAASLFDLSRTASFRTWVATDMDPSHKSGAINNLIGMERKDALLAVSKRRDRCFFFGEATENGFFC
jgi:hypothetical protein